MGEVKLYFKMVETGQYVPGGSDGYVVQTDQTIEDLKIGVESYYNIPNFNSSWLFKLNSDSGVVLDNFKTVKDSGLKDNDVLFIQDPDLVRISYVDNGTTKSVWAQKSDTLETIKNRIKPAQAKDYDFILQVKGRKLEDQSMVHSLFDSVSLNLEPSLKTPRTILPGLLEGNYRLYNNRLNTYILVSPDDLYIGPTTNASTATYFKVELDLNAGLASPKIYISYLGDGGIRRYLWYHWVTGSEYLTVLSTSVFSWSVQAGQYSRYSLLISWYLTIEGQKIGFNPTANQDWSFVP